MARRPDRRKSSKPRTERKAQPPGPEPAELQQRDAQAGSAFWTRPRLALAVVLLLGVHALLAVLSLVRENPTIDEVAHLPAGITYWQTGTFRLYPHNPPLVKLAAALPVVWAHPEMSRIYGRPSWEVEPPIHASIAHEFAVDNASRYFELFTLGRLVIPAFSVLGGLVVFSWSYRLYGAWGGLLSLALWSFCPNVLAHARLVTTDIGATALGVGATYLFWRYLTRRTWDRAALAGLALGLAALAKFSNLLLFGLWPWIWLADELTRGRAGLARRLALSAGQGGLVVVLALLTINVGYGFEGSFRRLGSFEFASGLLTGPRPPGTRTPVCANSLLNMAWQHRVNRFRGTVLEDLPTPVPAYYAIGFDLQKFEAEGVPKRFFDPDAPEDAISGYPVYLDGELRESGWWYYYLATLAYKLPEGTWAIVLLSLGVLAFSPRSRARGADEFAVAVVPVVVLGAMSFGTDINLGLRYILPAFPYVFIAAGKVGPWAACLPGRGRPWAVGGVGVCLGATILATALAHPHYLAYFNWISGGTARGSEHLIDSNLDWGQDLVNLDDWVRRNARPGERIGLAYFGQINPNLLRLRGAGFDWFLAPPRPGTLKRTNPTWPVEGPPDRLEPGLYAVSASFLRGLPYSLYDGSLRIPNLYPAWDARGVPGAEGRLAFDYFQTLRPIARVGGSIFVYRVTAEDAARLAPIWGDET